MAIPIRIKRRDVSNADTNAPGSLSQGEVAFNEYSQVLYYGLGSTPSVVAIGGPGKSVNYTGATGLVAVTATQSGATPHTTAARSIAGTTNEIDVANGDGVAGNPTVGLADNAIVPGTASLTIPAGADGDRPGSPTNGMIRYNTTSNILEWYDANATAWEVPLMSNATLDDIGSPTTSFSFNSQLLTNLATPVSDTDAATKGYVDGVAQGLDVKESVRVLSDSTSSEGTTYAYSATGGTAGRGQITWATGPTAIDGVTLTNNDRILNTETGAAGGIYVRTSQNTWDRAEDFDEDSEVTSGAFTFVEEGTTYADSGWVLSTDGTITIGGSSGTSLDWAQFSGAGSVTAGAGLTKTGNTLDVNVDNTTIEITTDTLNVKEGAAYQVLRTNAGATAAEWGAIDISQSAAVTGTLAAGNGGTSQSTYTTGDLLYASAANTLSKLGVGSDGNVLHVASGAPAWATSLDGGTF